MAPDVRVCKYDTLTQGWHTFITVSLISYSADYQSHVRIKTVFLSNDQCFIWLLLLLFLQFYVFFFLVQTWPSMFQNSWIWTDYGPQGCSRERRSCPTSCLQSCFLKTPEVRTHNRQNVHHQFEKFTLWFEPLCFVKNRWRDFCLSQTSCALSHRPLASGFV